MRKLLTIIALACVSFCLITCFGACGGKHENDNNKDFHVHTIELRQEQPSTCTENGVRWHYFCIECEKYFEDPTATVEITADDLIIYAEHSYVDGICGVCGYHVCSYNEWINEVPATCQRVGTKGHYLCSICENYYDENYELIENIYIQPNPSVHVLGQWSDETPATCCYEGLKGYYQCSDCKKYLDKDFVEIDDLSLPVDSSKHDYQWIDGEDPSCEEDGEMDYYFCDVCQTVFDEDKNIFTGDTYLLATGHEWNNGSCLSCQKPYFSQGLSYDYKIFINGPIGWYVSIGDCTETDIIIPETYMGDTVIGISNYFSEYYKDFSSVTIPDSVIYIGEYAFEECTSLVEVIGGENVTSIGKYAFYNCANMENTVSLKNVDKIYEYTFYQCSSLKNVQLCEELSLLENNSFNGCSSLESVNLGNCLGVVSSYAFDGCTNLKNVALPETIKYISSNAFSSCSSLQNLQLPNSIEYLGSSAFYECSKLQSINIPEKIVDINSATFANCTSLSEVNFEGNSSVVKIWNNAFTRCSSLQTIVLPEKLTNIERGVFSRSGLTEITIPDTVEKLGYDDMHPGEVFLGCEDLVTVTIGNGIEVIGKSLFSGCTSLENVFLGEKVAEIKDNAFIGCSNLKNIVIGNSIKYISDNAFLNCKLDNLNYNKSNNGLYLGNDDNPYSVLMDVENVTSITQFTVQEALTLYIKARLTEQKF